LRSESAHESADVVDQTFLKSFRCSLVRTPDPLGKTLKLRLDVLPPVFILQ